MSDLLNVATRALLANQAALSTTGNNISNVNTQGYSRQVVQFAQVPGQSIQGGYVGKGVQVESISRAHNDFLTRNVALTGSVAAMDSARATRYLQLEDIFPSGTTGLGSSLNDMLNAFSDVASNPSDLTARTVVISKADELATRFQSASSQLDDLATGVRQELTDSVASINSLTDRIASLNGQFAKAQGSGKAPNDLLDARDQAVKDLNGYVQTSTVMADDGTMSVFLGSQPLVLGTRSSPVSLQTDDYTDLSKIKLVIKSGSLTTVTDENTLGGGSVAGLLKFNNSDIADARNLVGRMALAVTTVVNAQHKLGVDLNGNTGSNFFSPQTLPSGLAANTNTGNANLGVTVADPTQFVASDYEVRVGAGGAFTIIRQSDGQATSYPGPMPVTQDGITFNITSGTAASGDRFMVKPFSAAAATMQTAIVSASALAVASPVQATAASSNSGTIAVQGMTATSANANLTQTVTLTFTGAGTFDVTGTGTGNPTGVTYSAGQAISYNGWQLNLKGTPQAGDVITVQVANGAYSGTNSGNATALMGIRDQAMFGGVTVADGYASMMSEIGVRSQSAQYAANVSSSIATSAATAESGVSGVNLDEEAAKLLQYQQAYQASAKMIQISQSIFDSLVQSLGN